MPRSDRRNRFVSQPGEYILTQCCYCKHRSSSETDLGCTAFPDGIPQAIRYNRVDHRLPYEGDHGVRFEAHGDPSRAGLKALFRELDALPDHGSTVAKR